MWRKLIWPSQVKVINRTTTANFLLSSQPKRWASVITPSNKSRNAFEQNLMADYPTCPKKYDGNSVAQDAFYAMQFWFEKYGHSYDKRCKEEWHSIVENHLDTPATMPLSKHPLYKEAIKNPSWAYLVLLRSVYGHRAIARSKMFRIYQSAYPKSDLNTNEYNEDFTGCNSIQRVKANVKAPTSKPAPRKHRGTFLLSVVGGELGDHTSTRKAGVPLRGACQEDQIPQPLSMAELSYIEKVLDEMKGSISDLKAECGIKIDEEVKHRKTWVAIAKNKHEDIVSLQKQVAAIQNELETFKQLTSEKAGTEVPVKGRDKLVKAEECHLAPNQPFAALFQYW